MATKTSKQDRTFARTAMDIERKYDFDKSFSQAMNLAEQAKRQADEAYSVAVNIKGIFFFIRYSAYADGTNMTEEPQEDTVYMGTCSTNVDKAPTEKEAYTWTKILGNDGANGEKGDTGVGVSNIKAQYCISSSKTTPPTSGWQDTMPVWSKGTYLWIRHVVTYTNGNKETTEPLCDSSWEAVNDLNALLNHDEVFNRLTNNGIQQGIYRDENGDIYINGEYVEFEGATIGGWKIGKNAIYKDVTINGTDYCVYFQPPVAGYEKTWVLSCQQRGDDGGMYGNFILFSDGSAKFGDLYVTKEGSMYLADTTGLGYNPFKMMRNADGTAYMIIDDVQVRNKPANTVLAAPNSVDGTATFRKMVAYDIPDSKHVKDNIALEINAIGWYRIYQSASGSWHGDTVKFSLMHGYSYSKTEAYDFSVSVGYWGNIDITQLSGIRHGTITKIRVVRESNDIYYIDFYYSQELRNPIYLYGSGKGAFQTPALVDSVPSDATVVEFDTTTGCKSSSGFTGDLNGRATSAGSADTAIRANTAGASDKANVATNLFIEDIRATAGLPSQYPDYRLSTFFNDINLPPGVTYWKSGIHVKGWTTSNSYSSWELASEASNLGNLNAPLAFRSGYGDTWGSWKIVDTVVASSFISGTSNDWHYIKFNSGLAMCWRNSGTFYTDFSATWGSWYIHDYLFPARRFPFDFAEIPRVFASPGPPGDPGCDFSLYSDGGATTQYTPRYSAFRPATVAQTVWLSIDLFAIGRWK